MDVGLSLLRESCMAEDNRQAHYTDTLRDLLTEAAEKKEPALLLEAITVTLGAMGAVIDRPDHLEMYLDDIRMHVAEKVKLIRNSNQR